MSPFSFATTRLKTFALASSAIALLAGPSLALTSDQDGGNGNASSPGTTATAFGDFSNAVGDDNTSFGNIANSGGGVSATSHGDTSIGSQANSGGNGGLGTGNFATAIGFTSFAGSTTGGVSGDNATALGAFSNASTGGTAVGASAKAITVDSVAIGIGAQSGTATGLLGGQIAIGKTANAQGLFSIALGYETSVNGDNAVSVNTGPLGGALAAKTIAIGNQSSVLAAGGQGSIAMGFQSKVVSGIGAVALGSQSQQRAMVLSP